MTHDAEIDARDLLCPLPVLKARKGLERIQPGQVLRVLATDPVAVVDMPHFCGQAGHEYLGMTEEEGAQVHLIRRGIP
ncbi:sulfurtransferase TusA family protein [Loktanella sp. IMCC34160]|uniref:sulfurtransferase TusA family protein n=1 Tax=Loktanella sp. IMCC34160 TaxID=2510646 RepID=UPI00101D3C83|nr:sulfurtransferase TusA family protein [Loktanella sp. IMCC34160]RYG90767.1 sulfurtransferase TusA family protein [Loktanella sp. IMCC34160]